MSKNLIVYDNEGETFDRYTVITPTGNVYSMSDVPHSPNGVFQFSGTIEDFPDGFEHCGKRILDYPSSLDIALSR